VCWCVGVLVCWCVGVCSFKGLTHFLPEKKAHNQQTKSGNQKVVSNPTLDFYRQVEALNEGDNGIVLSGAGSTKFSEYTTLKDIPTLSLDWLCQTLNEADGLKRVLSPLTRSEHFFQNAKSEGEADLQLILNELESGVDSHNSPKLDLVSANSLNPMRMTGKPDRADGPISHEVKPRNQVCSFFLLRPKVLVLLFVVWLT
jgi:hypothetical protein